MHDLVLGARLDFPDDGIVVYTGDTWTATLYYHASFPDCALLIFEGRERMFCSMGGAYGWLRDAVKNLAAA